MRPNLYLWLLPALLGCRGETVAQMRDRMARESVAFREASAAVKDRYQRFTEAGLGDSIASLFTEDGRQLPPNAPAITGRAAIAASEREAASVYASRLALTSEQSTANGPLAVETGTYHIVSTPRPGSPAGTPSIDESGKYLGHWRLVDGRWQIVELMWNTSQPLSISDPPANRPR